MKNFVPNCCRGVRIAACVAAVSAFAGPATAQVSDETVQRALELARDAAAALAPPRSRVEATAGALDSRLRLAPCAKVVPYLPAGVPAWGRTRVGLRCTAGPRAWNVYLPVTVRVWARAPALRDALPAGARIAAEQLQMAETDWAAAAGVPIVDATALAGRTLARPLAAGQPVRTTDLKARRWFDSGEPVQVVARGAGFAVSVGGLALGHGIEGQPVRVRTEGGRVVVGRAVAAGRVEIAL